MIIDDVVVDDDEGMCLVLQVMRLFVSNILQNSAAVMYEHGR